jgi:hypothetical protein
MPDPIRHPGSPGGNRDPAIYRVSDFRRNEAGIPASAGMTKNAVSYGAQDDQAREKKILSPGFLILLINEKNPGCFRALFCRSSATALRKI